MKVKIKNKEEIRCEYCQSGDNKFICYREYDANLAISRKDVFCIYKCNNCDIFFSFPKPTTEDSIKFFQGIYHSVRYRRTLQDVLKGYPRRGFWTGIIMRAKKSAKRILVRIRRTKDIDIDRIIRKHIDSSTKKRFRVCEIGLGTAPLLYLQYMGYDYIGIEPAKEVVDIFNRKGYQNIRQGFGENLAFLDKASLDAVIFISTLSHVYNLKEVLGECHRILKDKGIILILDSNADEESYRNIKGAYTNYGFPRVFLENSVHGFKLEEYLCINSHRRIDKNGNKMLAVLRKRD